MASRNLGSLTIDLIAKTGGFERGMDRAARVAQTRARQIDRTLGRAFKVAAVAATAAATAIASGMTVVVGKVSQVSAEMDAMTKAADRVQMSVDSFGRLVYAGDQADVSMQDLQSTIARLTRSMSASLDPASRQANLFKALGINARDSEGNLRSATEVLYDFADAFAMNRDSPELMAAGLEIFGRSFQNIIPLIKDGSQSIRDMGDEGERLGVVFDEQAGRNAERFQDNLTRLRTAVNGMWVQVATQLLPTLEDTTDRLVDLVREGHLAANAVSLLDAAVRAGVGALERYNEAVRRTSIFMGLSVEAGAGMREMMLNLVAPWSEGTILGGARKMRDAWRDAEEQFERTGEAAEGVQVILAGIDEAPSGLFAKSEMQLKMEGQIEEMRKRLAEFFNDPTGRGSRAAADAGKKLLEEMLREQQRLAEAQQGWSGRLLDAQAAIQGPVAEAYRQHQRQMQELAIAYDDGEVKLSDFVQMQEVYDEQLRRNLEAIEAQKTPFQRLLEDIQFETDLLAMSNEQREIAIATRWLNADATDAEREAIAKAIRELRASREAYGDLIEAQDAVRDAGANFLTDLATGSKSFKDAMLDALNSIHQRITRMISERLMDQLFGQRGQDGGGQFGNWLSGLFSGMFGGGKASGGWAMPNTIYEVNERGLEMATVGGKDYMLTGNKPVRVTPNHQLGGGPVVLNMNNNYAAPQSNKTVTQVAARTSYELARARRLGQ